MSTSQASTASPLIRIPLRPASSLATQFATPAPPPPPLQRQHSGVPAQTPAMAAHFISQNNPAGHRRYLNAAQREASFERLLEGAGLRRGDPIPGPGGIADREYEKAVRRKRFRAIIDASTPAGALKSVSHSLAAAPPPVALRRAHTGGRKSRTRRKRRKTRRRRKRLRRSRHRKRRKRRRTRRRRTRRRH